MVWGSTAGKIRGSFLMNLTTTMFWDFTLFLFVFQREFEQSILKFKTDWYF